MVPVLAAAAFVIFAQIFMIAPVLPALAQAFSTTPGHIGLAIPLYLIPHGVLTLVWGPISDRFGRRRVIMGSLIAFVVLAALTTLAPTANTFLATRMVTALAASGVVPIALALVGDLVPYQQRGHALGWLFGGMAGGMAFGAAGGALRTADRMARLVRGRRRVRTGTCHRCDGSARFRRTTSLPRTRRLPRRRGI